jgi:hypothetical protein
LIPYNNRITAIFTITASEPRAPPAYVENKLPKTNMTNDVIGTTDLNRFGKFKLSNRVLMCSISGPFAFLNKNACEATQKSIGVII